MQILNGKPDAVRCECSPAKDGHIKKQTNNSESDFKENPDKKMEKAVNTFDRWANGNQYGSFNSDED